MSTFDFKFAQLQPFYLSGSGVSAGATTITLKSMTDIDGNSLTMSGSFGTKGFGTLEPGNGMLEEQICFTGLVNNANGTVTLTGVCNVGFEYPYTETSGLSKTHAGSTTFIISNTSGFYNKIVSKDDDATITAHHDFPTGANNPTIGNVTYVAPTAATQIATKGYVDSVAFGTTTVDQVIIAGVAGENLTVGNAVYLKVSDGKWYKTSAASAATCDGVQLGFAQQTATTGNGLNILTSGLDKNQTGRTPGAIQYLSDTSGAISESAGTVSVVIGEARELTTQVLLNPRYTQVPTGAQKAALSSTTAASGSNLYVSQSDLQKNPVTYGASVVGTDAYAITPSPSISAYSAGMRFLIRLDVANTGAATLAVGSGAAKAIVKNYNSALVTGDLLAGQVIEVAYDSTNDVWQLISPLAYIPQYKSGTSTSRLFQATSSTLNIAHGLGRTPLYVRITASIPPVASNNVVNLAYSVGTYNGSSTATLYWYNTGTTSGTVAGVDATNIVYLFDGTNGQSATATFDATNIALAFTKISSPANNNPINIMWEAWA